MPFETPLLVAHIMAGFDRPWFVAGGWAVDLHLGRVTRLHRDIEIAGLRRDQARIRQHLSRWSFEKVVGGRLQRWREHEVLAAPVHEIHASRPTGDPGHLEILLDDAEGEDWVFRRDRQIRRPIRTLGAIAASGIPYLAPGVVLLFKAKSPGPVDEVDFHHLAPSLDAHEREWLRGALATCHPGHPWGSRLARLPEKL